MKKQGQEKMIRSPHLAGLKEMSRIDDMERLQLSLGGGEHRIHQLEETVRTMMKENGQLLKQLKDTDEARNRAEEKLAAKTQLILCQKEQIEDLRNQNETLQKDYCSLNKRVHELREKNICLAKKLAKISTALGGNRRRLSFSRMQHEPDAFTAIQEMEALKDTTDLIIQSKEEELDAYRSKERASEELISIMRNKMSDMEKSMAVLEQEKEKSERKNTALKASIMHCDRAIEKMLKEGLELKSSAEAAIDSAVRSSKHRELLLEIRLNKDKKMMGRTISELKSKVQNANNELDRMQKEIKALLPLREEKEKSAKKWREMVIRKEETIFLLNRDLLEATEKLKKMENEKITDPELHISASILNDAPEDFNLYQPVVNNLEFLFDIKDRALKEMKLEMDEAWSEAQKYKLMTEKLRRQLGVRVVPV
eukprot:CAMPEP_0183295420 /NCGR_PEP_ID=MMETSP0160_2-20130417/3384_1 /TAXON_ID=2839 ORGANISM="Odontella Sinensis, Strain Grunow 1884" /NCGR_SAMPLE_ID=MMETSP0160_2 /ASSEMBLY_ACC=CAM_ASM_000250 /LENGTH=424 /DNA_ID=CAMNT_0025456901 /DNA_START=10 /DNA_END=1284 /DNA_ORIENTATION=+